MNNSRIYIPADVPQTMYDTFTENMQAITQGTPNSFIFSCDQKIEHLNDDFFGDDITPDALYPEHLFTIASQSPIGAMAAPLGLISRHGTLFPQINYIVKISGATNSISSDIHDKMSAPLWSVEDVISFKNTSNLAIRGVGITLYVGSDYEPAMLTNTAQTIHKAHQHGLVAMAWVYARGRDLEDVPPSQFPADLCGLAHALGADIVKIKKPEDTPDLSAIQQLRVATSAAGNTAVVCAGGVRQDTQPFLQNLSLQIQEGKTRGCAVGRTIFQKPVAQAIALSHAISALVYQNDTAENAWQIYQQKLSTYHLQMQSK